MRANEARHGAGQSDARLQYQWQQRRIDDDDDDVNAEPDDEFGFSSGTVYVFSKYNVKPPASACGGNVEVGTWVQCQKLLPDDGQPHDQFGKSVDVSGNTIVVGSMWDDAKGIDSGEQRSGGKCNLNHIRHCLTNTFHNASSNH